MLKKDTKCATQISWHSCPRLVQQEKTTVVSPERRKADKPMFLMGEFPWNEMNIDDELTLRCEDSFYREIETRL